MFMKIQIGNHQDKSDALRQALETAGHEIVYVQPDALLIDFDGPIAHYPKTIERAYEQGAEIFLYSHGAMPLTCWDGIWKPSDKIHAFLAQTPGQKRVMEAYNYPHPIHVIGWHYSHLAQFSPTAGKKVLFAPWHPQGTGWLIPEGREANERVFNLLRQIPGIELRVRFVGRLEDNNLTHENGVIYERSDKMLESSIDSIENADLVIGYGTLAYLSVALGKPTVMFGQDCTPYDGYSPETCAYVKHWKDYQHLMYYKHDGDTNDVDKFKSVMERACREEDKEWREEFIGEPFDPQAFCGLLVRLTGEKNYA